MPSLIQPVRGTVDYYPEEMALRTWLNARMREVCESFGYSEYEGPMLERFELYAAKSGAELVEKQSYVFEDRGGDRIALRPELTPTLARMVAARQKQLTFPLRWWSFGPFWRYEKPQKGRSREFFQWNVDLIGDESPEADAEIAAIAATFLKNAGLRSNETQILVNNRQLMQEELEGLAIKKQTRIEVFNLIDRRDKLSIGEWKKRGQEIGLDEVQIMGIESLMENNDLWKKSPGMQRFFKAIDVLGVQDYVRFAPWIIRGLDYYTGTVFEAWDTAGEFRAIFGGGRYDNLVNAMGGDPVPAVGLAIGNVVISLMLQAFGHLPDLHGGSPIFITAFDQDHLHESLSLAAELRRAGLKVTSQLTPDKLQKQFRQADRTGARLVLVLGPDEVKEKTVSVKDLRTGDQRSTPRTQLVHQLNLLLK